jgi:hypothetical protein
MNSFDSSPISLKERLIFVVGNSRSGTTLLGKILGLNPNIFTFEELHFFENLWTSEEQDLVFSEERAEQLAARLLCIQENDYVNQNNFQDFSVEAREIISQVSKNKLNSLEIFKTFLQYVVSKNNKIIPCEQTPRNVFYISEILESYPESRIINMIRDPRDVLLSQKYKWRLRFLGAKNIPYHEAFRSWCNYHPITISKLWNASINAANKFEHHPRFCTVRFEDLVTNPENTMQEICNFVEIDFQKEMLKVSQNSSHKKRTQELKGIDPNATGRWKGGGLSDNEIFLCQQIARDNMNIHNYSSLSIKPIILSLYLSYFSFPVKLLLSLMLNLNRTQNIVNAVKRRL